MTSFDRLALINCFFIMIFTHYTFDQKLELIVHDQDQDITRSTSVFIKMVLLGYIREASKKMHILRQCLNNGGEEFHYGIFISIEY